jgi:hypothetical protein
MTLREIDAFREVEAEADSPDERDVYADDLPL